ncbi:MAG: hypothetical protein Harvfovirus6_12 [Harvfovirus sp.]|uniref:Uncharacterized protein n=1 Tax=Harvfovirus sp. TaxID=2487768 RepID=A0A3G5A0R3_9VIRU|nr:MAG: hypothetical protein Harvfovirus6_12 [Harvfovirus sp.]
MLNGNSNLINGMRRFSFIVRQSCRLLTPVASRIPRRIPERSLFLRKFVTLTTAAASIPIIAAITPQNPSYHAKAIDYIKNEEWDIYLESPEKYQRSFTKTLEYLRYCQQHSPELKTIFIDIDFEKLIYKLIALDTTANKIHYLKIFSDTFGFDNLPKPMKIFYKILRDTNIPWLSPISAYIFSNIHNEASQKEILTILSAASHNREMFEIIKIIISTSKTKIIVPGYSKYADSYNNFYYFASRNLIDPAETDQYFEKIMYSSDCTPRQTRRTLDYLIALNPDPSAKKALTLITLNVIQYYGTTEERKTFLSSLIDTIDYTFTEEEAKIFSEAVGTSYNALKNHQSKTDAQNFIQYISSSHPKLGIKIELPNPLESLY